MYWILAAVFIVIALAVPRLRPLGIAGSIVLGLLLGWGMVQRLRGNDPAAQGTPQRGRSAAPTAGVQAIALAQIDVEDLELTGSGAPFELRGHVVNRTADTLLKSITVLVTRHDCYEGALDPSGCVVLWQDRHWVAVSVPARQARDFAISIWMRGSAPRGRGELRDSFEVVAASGERSAAPQRDDE